MRGRYIAKNVKGIAWCEFPKQKSLADYNPKSGTQEYFWPPHIWKKQVAFQWIFRWFSAFWEPICFSVEMALTPPPVYCVNFTLFLNPSLMWQTTSQFACLVSLGDDWIWLPPYNILVLPSQLLFIDNLTNPKKILWTILTEGTLLTVIWA